MDPRRQSTHLDDPGPASYLLFDIEPRSLLWSARVIDQAITPGGRVSTLARFVVETGRAEVSKT